eukprot:6468884-Amphidinium_carterae.1
MSNSKKTCTPVCAPATQSGGYGGARRVANEQMLVQCAAGLEVDDCASQTVPSALPLSEDIGDESAAEQQSFAAINARDRKEASAWLRTKPFGHMVMMRL